MKLSDLHPDKRNANKGTAKGQKLIVNSIQHNGFGRSGLLDRKGNIIAGNKATEAAAEVFGVDVEPVIIETDGTRPVYVRRTDLDLDDPDPNNPARRLAYLDNVSSFFSFDLDPTAVMVDIEAGFDFEAIDLSLPDLGEMLEKSVGDLLGGNGKQADTEPQIDRAEELQKVWQVKAGDLWQLGEHHRLICGDCTDRAVVERVMGGERAEFGIQDPPYGISVVGGSKPFGSVGGSNIVRANNYHPIVNDDKPYDPSYILSLCPNQILWGANYYADKLPPKKGWIVWDKKGKDWDDNFSDCELAWTPFEVVTKIYRHLWMGIVQEGKRENRQHPTQKPSALYEKLITDYFIGNGIIIDFYLGSGTTLIACHNLSRRCRGIEISPQYVSVCLQRYLDHTGQQPERINQEN